MKPNCSVGCMLIFVRIDHNRIGGTQSQLFRTTVLPEPKFLPRRLLCLILHVATLRLMAKHRNTKIGANRKRYLIHTAFDVSGSLPRPGDHR